MVKLRLKRYGGKQRVTRISGSFLRTLVTAISESKGNALISTYLKIDYPMKLEHIDTLFIET